MTREPPKTAGEITEREIVNPIDPTLTSEQKAEKLCDLSVKNKQLIDAFIKEIDIKYGTVSTSNCKLKERILAKASRPAIQTEKPWFDVEHIRDGLRFRTALADIRDLPKIVSDLKKKRH
jgi:hypothetical protein